jgi:putative oxidoreductase
MRIVRLATRLLVGGLFVGHGTQKLMGAFNGPGIEGTEKMMSKLEMEPAKANAYAVGVTETVGGAMFAAGARTPLAGGALIGTMITAIRKVHLKNGPWISDGGFEYNLVLIATILSIIEDGPGMLSIDRLRGKHQTGVPAALGALLLGAGASAAVVELSTPKAKPSAPVDGAPSYPASTSGPSPAIDLVDAKDEPESLPTAAPHD